MADKIRIQHLVKEFTTRTGQVRAIDDVSLTIPEGQFYVIVGPSGCGKTTLLRILAGLEEETGGSVEVSQKDRQKPVNSMVFQEQSIFPWMTVRDNVSYGLRTRRIDGTKREQIVNHYIQKVGLSRFANAYPFQLSGGMKQRCSVARAFANDPEILLMDEPFAALDEQNKLLLQEELLKIWEEDRKTVVFITHSIDEAVTLGDRVMIMTAHPGQVKAVVDVTLPRPREVYQLRANPEYGNLVYNIWELLRDEVLKAKAEEVKL